MSDKDKKAVEYGIEYSLVECDTKQLGIMLLTKAAGINTEWDRVYGFQKEFTFRIKIGGEEDNPILKGRWILAWDGVSRARSSLRQSSHAMTVWAATDSGDRHMIAEICFNPTKPDKDGVVVFHPHGVIPLRPDYRDYFWTEFMMKALAIMFMQEEPLNMIWCKCSLSEVMTKALNWPDAVPDEIFVCLNKLAKLNIMKRHPTIADHVTDFSLIMTKEEIEEKFYIKISSSMPPLIHDGDGVFLDEETLIAKVTLDSCHIAQYGSDDGAIENYGWQQASLLSLEEAKVLLPKKARRKIRDTLASPNDVMIIKRRVDQSNPKRNRHTLVGIRRLDENGGAVGSEFELVIIAFDYSRHNQG